MKDAKCKSIILFSMLIAGTVIAQGKPNVLWITIEDTSPQFIGCYENEDARTPAIDKLASDGVRFTNAFSCGTVSSPSRSCIITGVKTYVMGTVNHRSAYPVPDYIKGFPYYLKQKEYYTSNNYKTDYNVTNAAKFAKEAWNESSAKAGWWNRKPGQPFFAVFNFMDSHQSRTMTFPFTWYEENILGKLPLCDRIADNEFEMPPFYNDSPEMRKQFARFYNSIKLTDIKIDLVRSVTNGKFLYSRNFMPFMPEARYIRYVETSEITQLMRQNLAENKLNSIQKSIFNDRPAEFLFEIEIDRWETNNLAAKPEYKDLLGKMREQLKQKILQSRDVMLLPEYEMALQSKSTTPYEFRLNDENYPIAEIYKAAILSGYRGKNISKQQIELLKNPNEILRYWAALDLRSQRAKDLKPNSKKIKRAMNDVYPTVAVTASAISFEVFGDKMLRTN